MPGLTTRQDFPLPAPQPNNIALWQRYADELSQRGYGGRNPNYRPEDIAVSGGGPPRGMITEEGRQIIRRAQERAAAQKNAALRQQEIQQQMLEAQLRQAQAAAGGAELQLQQARGLTPTFEAAAGGGGGGAGGGVTTAPRRGLSDEARSALAELRAALAEQEGVAGGVETDPEAVAYRNAMRRNVEEARGAEAARLGASGVTGGGEFDARLAGLREAAGQNIAGFEGALVGRRRRERTAARQARVGSLQRLFETLAQAS